MSSITATTTRFLNNLQKDTPLYTLAREPYHPCRFVKTNGEPCAAYAQTGSELCYFHRHEERQKLAIADRVRAQRAARNLNGPAAPDPLDAAELFNDLDLPPLDDVPAVHRWVTIVLRALAAGQLQPKAASAMLYGLQLALSASRLGVEQMRARAKSDYVERLERQIVDLEHASINDEERETITRCDQEKRAFPPNIREKLGLSSYPAGEAPWEIEDAANAAREKEPAGPSAKAAASIEKQETRNQKPPVDPEYPGRKPGEDLDVYARRKRRERDQAQWQQNQADWKRERGQLATQVLPHIKASAEIALKCKPDKEKRSWPVPSLAAVP